MKKRVLTIIMGFILVFSLVVGCNKKGTEEETVIEEQTTSPEEYYDAYTRNYEASLSPLSEYRPYDNITLVDEYYEENDYPGNEKYLDEVKTALKDTRDKLQEFVDNMKKDAVSEDKEITKLNDDLIDRSEKLITSIDDKIKKLDDISKEDLKKSDADFRRLVGDTVRIEEKETNDFKDMIKNLDEKLGITRDKDNKDNKTDNNSNNNSNSQTDNTSK